MWGKSTDRVASPAGVSVPLKLFIPGELFYHNFLDQSFSNSRVCGSFLLLSCFIAIRVLNANRVDPDQTPRSAASDLGLLCLLMSVLWDARHKWVKESSSLIVVQSLKLSGDSLIWSKWIR